MQWTLFTAKREARAGSAKVHGISYDVHPMAKPRTMTMVYMIHQSAKESVCAAAETEAGAGLAVMGAEAGGNEDVGLPGALPGVKPL